MQTAPTYLAADFAYAGQKLPLVPGQIHFLRQVSATGTVKILNHEWPVPEAAPQQGVWATLTITLSGATLRIYDAAPDQARRTELARHTFPVEEPILTPETVYTQLQPATAPTTAAPPETVAPVAPPVATHSALHTLLPQPPTALPGAWLLFIVSGLGQRRTRGVTSRSRDG